MTIPPRTLKGFRDFLPAAMNARERLIETAREVYRSFGFAPIDTPALEYLEILLGKGSEETDRQLYRFEDHGGRQVGMRFDLTVPLARFVAQYSSDLGMPFKRYQIGKVWRGENTQHGRYREFMQCDFDTIGTMSLIADSEMVVVAAELMRALGIERFTIRLNHRQVLSGVLQQAGLTSCTAAVLRALDKIHKIGPDGVAAELAAGGSISRNQIDQVLEMAKTAGPPSEVLDRVRLLVADSTIGQSGLFALERICDDLRASSVPDPRFMIDLSIARGLDYYSGTVLETMLDDLPAIGSVCSGGRYDDLASLYTKEKLPGVGASLGLDRMLAAMEELGILQASAATAAVLIVFFDEAYRTRYLQLAARLRRNGIGVELYPDVKKIGAQLKYADRRGFQLALIAGEQEFASGVCQLKDLTTHQSRQVSLEGDTLEREVLGRGSPSA